jgi:hypothetical protein
MSSDVLDCLVERIKSYLLNLVIHVHSNPQNFIFLLENA